MSRAAAEIHIYQHLKPSGETRQDYVVIWKEVLEAELPTDEGYIFSALIQAANAYAQTAHAATVSDTKPTPTHILKNHNLWDINDGNKLEKDIKYERLMSAEERDELWRAVCLLNISLFGWLSQLNEDRVQKYVTG